MINSFTTDRLSLNPLTGKEAKFIFELLNSPGWLEFIGDRYVKNEDDAVEYIKNILNNPAIVYWVVKLKEEDTAIGIVSFIKREYLAHHDIGFAFLPRFGKKGYAAEAVNAVLKVIAKDRLFTQILATVAPDNINSVQLLEKLGLQFDSRIEVAGKGLLLYRIMTDKLYI